MQPATNEIDTRDPLEILAEEFIEGVRRGDGRDIGHYTTLRPDLATEIRSLFPAMLLMEKLRPSDAEDCEDSSRLHDVPEQLGDYHILREIGRGGMGVVYLAEQESLGRRVALKVVRTGPLHDVKFQQRFERESKAAGRLHHTNIVPVFGVGTADGFCYLVMQYVHGQGLDAVIDELRRLKSPTQLSRDRTWPNGALTTITATAVQGGGSTSFVPADATPSRSLSNQFAMFPQRVARIGLQVAAALEYAHSQGILHRDIKPSNLLLDTTGHVWVADFGLAKASDSDDLTGTNDMVGTVRYMAPERFRGGADARSDVYGLGLTLYELVTGRPVFDENDRHKLIDQVMHGEPADLGGLEKFVPIDLATIIRKAIAREPRDRYASAGALAQDLQRFLDDRPILARRIGVVERARRWCKRNTAVAGLTAAIAILIVVGFSTITWLWRDTSSLLEDAVDSRKVADAARLNAERESHRAAGLAAANHQQLVQRQVASGTLSWTMGEPVQALLSFADALRLDEGDREKERFHRIRLNAFLSQAPSIEQFWYAPGGVGSARFSRDGRLIVAADYLRWGPRNQRTTGAAHVWDAKTGRPVHTLSHGGVVRQATFNGDNRIVTASDDGSARIWNSQTGTAIGEPFRLSGEPIMSAVLNPDGKLLAAAGEEGVAAIWDVETHERLFEPMKHDSSVVQVAFSPDSKRLVTASTLGQVNVWDTQTGKRVYGPMARAGCRAVFSPDGRRLLTWFNAPETIVWDVTGETIVPLAKTPPSRHAAFSPEGERLLVCYQNGGAQIFAIDKTLPLTPVLSSGNWIWQADFSRDGRFIATAGDDRVVRLWDASGGRPVPITLPHTSTILGIEFHPTRPELITACEDGTVRLWNSRTTTEPDQTFPLSGVGHDLAISGRFIAAASGTSVGVWDRTTGALAFPALKLEGEASSVAFNSAGRRLLTGDSSGAVQIWDAESGKLLDSPFRQAHGIRSARFTPDGRTIVVVTETDDGAPFMGLIWDLEARKFILQEPRVSRANFDRDGRRVILTAAKTARVFDARTGKLLLPPLNHDGEVWSASFNADGTRILTACADTSLDGLYAQIWDAATGEPVGSRMSHADGVLTAAFTPDGTCVATGSEDKIARVWDAKTGRPLTPDLRHINSVYQTAFSPDGSSLLTTSGEVKLWESRTGHPLMSLPPNAVAYARKAMFVPEGDAIVTLGDDGVAKLWRLRVDRSPAADWVRKSQFLAGHRIDSAGYPRPLSAAELDEQWTALRDADSSRR